jgi:hypothetical protein
MRFCITILLVLFMFMGVISSFESHAQPILKANDLYTMKIPGVTAMAGSPAHLYILSKTGGLIVFRCMKDSLQWLYTVPKMQHRGHSLRADARYGYLFGDSLHFSIIDPTKFRNVSPAVKLPSVPHDAVRWKNDLFIALGSGGLGRLDLDTMPSLHSTVQKIKPSLFNGQSIIDIAASNHQMYVLSNRQEFFIFNKKKTGIHFKKKLSLPHSIRHIFETNGILMGSNKKGGVFKILPGGNLQKIGNIGEPVLRIKSWKKQLIIKGKSHRLWVLNKRGKMHLWKKDGKAGNYFAISRGQLWLCQYDQIERVEENELQNIAQPGIHTVETLSLAPVLKLQPIKNQVVPYPHALLIPIKLKTTLPMADIQLHLKTTALQAKIRGQSLYWKPDYDNIDKQYRFKIIATAPDGETSSTSFIATIEPYNFPPRFVSLQTISIPAGRLYHLLVQAEDPDGSNKHLIRYLGVNLPRGASINPETGIFRWKPDKQQIGKREFRIIATDQYGAASYEKVTIRVLKPKKD